ncbi:hypothetical protein [Rhodococcus sp. Leaf233]|uniref:hypothetical protein n=1 Tax=Rhodococcus sp. Leaf233 TaxID=1736302 RepID=UPI001F259BC4|nr:hypothetical protein [Rhodococcus sp. Leaf233]
MLPTSNPAASTALSGMVHGSQGSVAIGATLVDVGNAAFGALGVDSPHPATSIISPTTPVTQRPVALTTGWTRRAPTRFPGNLTPLLPTARPRSLESKGAQSTNAV